MGFLLSKLWTKLLSKKDYTPIKSWSFWKHFLIKDKLLFLIKLFLYFILVYIYSIIKSNIFNLIFILRDIY